MIVNTFSADKVAVWVEGEQFTLPREIAKIFIAAMFESGHDVQAYWADCVSREKELDARITKGVRHP